METEPLDPFKDCVAQDVLAIRLVDGTRLEGSYLTQARLHFLHVRDGSPQGKVMGPFVADEIASLRVVRTRDEVMEERSARQRGEPVPGILRRDRDGYEARLQVLANAAARVKGIRRLEIERQFDDVADEIELAKAKRRWMLAVAVWSRSSNSEPSKVDLSGGDLTAAMKFERPRPQDFDPDPKVRRARVPIPPEVAADPLSPPNMVRALKRHGFHARPSVVGEFRHDSADLLVDFPGGRQNGRFGLWGRMSSDGMVWHYGWDGNGSRADMRRQFRCLSGRAFAVFRAIVAQGSAFELEVDPAPDDVDTPTP